MVWYHDLHDPTVRFVPKNSEEDTRFKVRMAAVLKELRETAVWTQEQAAEAIGVPASKVGRWERAEFAPKGYDLGRAYRAYEPYGADWKWFFDPPEVVRVNPVRDRLDELAQTGAIAADAHERRVARRNQRAAAARHAARGRPSK